jgi:L-serine deaminase
MVTSAKSLSKIHQRVNAKAEERLALGSEIKMKPNTFWDDANEVFEKSMNGIEATNGQLAGILQAVVLDPERMSRVTDPKTLVNNINLLTRDISEHTARLHAIHAKHVTRSGGTVDADDTMMVVSINGEYADALEVYETVVMPTVTHILEQIGVIEELIASEQAAKEAAAVTALQDVNVVSDVEIKTETVNHA